MKTITGRFRSGLKWAAGLLVMLFLASCFSARQDARSETKGAIDPPPAVVEEIMLQLAEEGRAPADGGQIQAPPASAPAQAAPAASPSPQAAEEITPEEMLTVYLLDKNGYLAPMTMRIGTEASSASESLEARAEMAIRWLTADPQRKDQLPDGFAAPLPEGMKAESITADLDSGTVSVDFAEPMPAMPAAGERKMIEALVWSMTELPGIDKVKLSAGRQPIRTLPTSGLPVDEVLTRGIGINIEPLRGVHVAEAMAVTVYFPALADNGDGYFVPVTRLVSRTPDRMTAALEALMRGPADPDVLGDVWMSGFELEDLSLRADTVNVALRSKDWTPGEALPAVMLEALVLTMTEAAGAPQVKVAVNGSDTFTDTANRAYDRPVHRPAAVNLPAS